jgi:hypothetical protein
MRNIQETDQAKDKERYHDGNLECTHNAGTRKDSKRRKGRPWMRWLADAESDLRKIKVNGWKEKTRDRKKWRQVVEEAKAHPGL